VPARIANQSCLLQCQRALSDPLAPNAEHVTDQFLRHVELVTPQSIETQQQPATELLIQRVMPIANRGLRHLRNEGLGVAQLSTSTLSVT
jgi:hypothetical protein